MLGRLYNSGVKLRALCESFQVAPKTIRRWGKALLPGDPVELIRVLEGRAAGRKRTVEVERFARLRWPELVAERRYGAVKRLRREVQTRKIRLPHPRERKFEKGRSVGIVARRRPWIREPMRR